MRILVLQHLAVEHPGVFREFMTEDGVRWDTVELDANETIADLACYDLMMVMGGPQDVWQESDFPWLVAEKAAIRKFVVELRRPYLGICLGHQLLASAIGGDVGPAAVPEVGILPVKRIQAERDDALFAGLPDSFLALQWHGAEVKSLPADAVILASSPACAIQAFTYGTHAIGIQFHIEATHDTVANWAAIPAYARALEQSLGKDATQQLARDVQDRLPEFEHMARQLYENLRKHVRGTSA
ncbi:MAG: type 1 glutamine amidotransferase [Hyphomicrobium sp.]|nr:type 1 glutamine amidotransferase [Hyphomicrobium sp.]